MNIRELTNQLLSEGLSKVEVARLFGVCLVQVKLYSTGRTKTAGVKTALSAMRHVTDVEGKPLIIKPFRGKQDVLDKVKMYEEQCAQVVRDHGYGQYQLKT